MFVPYQPRPISFLNTKTFGDFQLKLYSINLPGESFDLSRFDRAWELVGRELPHPACNAERLGIGFAILHQGRTGDYFILCWWDRENEMPLRVMIRDSEGWRMGRGSESVCVWDLQVIHAERNAYVETILTPGGGGVEAYLSRTHA